MNPSFFRSFPRVCRRLGAWGLVVLAAPSIGSAAGLAPTLVGNGDFETANASGAWPAGWAKPDSGTSRWEKNEHGRFLSLRASTPGQIVLSHQALDLRPEWRALEFKLRARSTKLVPGTVSWNDARVALLFKTTDGTAIAHGRVINFLSATEEWTARNVRFAVPPGAARLEIVPALVNVGQGTTFDLDDLVLAPIDPTALTAAEKISTGLTDLGPSAAPRIRWPAELHVAGNRLHDPAGKEVWLQGVNVVSLEWLVTGEYLFRAVRAALDDWKSNVVRLPVVDKFWFGHGPGQEDGGFAYRARVDEVIAAAAGSGAYVVLDLHCFVAPTERHADFWRDAARRYANHPAVLFDIFNEPNSISWETWRDGGFVANPPGQAAAVPATDSGVAVKAGFDSIGMQRLVEVVRSTGARNIVAVGGLDWAYDLSGIAKGFALQDKGGNGIMYSAHIYSWKRDWEGNVMIVAKDHPVLVGEVGCDIKKLSFVPPERHESPYTWAPDMIGYIQKHRLNWTAFSLHPAANPVLISDWKFTPTPFWGEFVKRALAGEILELKNPR